MENKIMNAALRNAGHYIDFVNKTVYVTRVFARKAEMYGSPEYEKMNEIEKSLKGFKIEMHMPSRKSSALVPYEKMVEFICMMPDAEKNYMEYERIKKMSLAHKSTYKYVNEWFCEKYPNYAKFAVKDENGRMSWNVIDMYHTALEEQENKQQPQMDTVIQFEKKDA